MLPTAFLFHDSVSLFSPEEVPDVFRHLVKAALPGFHCTPCHMGGEYQIRVVTEAGIGVVLREGFPGIDIHAETSQNSLLQSIRQSFLIRHRPTGGIDQDRALLHAENPLPAENSPGFLRKRNMGGKDIRLPAKGIDIRILKFRVGFSAAHQHPAAQSPRHSAHLMTDGAAAQNAPGFSCQLMPPGLQMVGRSSPGIFAGMDILPVFPQMGAQRQHQRKGQLGNTVCGIAGHIAKSDAPLLTPGGVNAVAAGGGNANQLQILCVPQVMGPQVLFIG